MLYVFLAQRFLLSVVRFVRPLPLSITILPGNAKLGLGYVV